MTESSAREAVSVQTAERAVGQNQQDAPGVHSKGNCLKECCRIPLNPRKGGMGYLGSKQRIEEQRQLAFVSTGAQPFSQVLQVADDEKVYDMDADDEAKQLDIDIDQERNSQKRWKAERRKQMGKWEKRTVISCWERRLSVD